MIYVKSSLLELNLEFEMHMLEEIIAAEIWGRRIVVVVEICDAYEVQLFFFLDFEVLGEKPYENTGEDGGNQENTISCSVYEVKIKIKVKKNYNDGGNQENTKSFSVYEVKMKIKGKRIKCLQLKLVNPS